MEKIDNKIICIREINENIRRVELKMPLTRSLRELNTNCEFKAKFNRMDKIKHREEIRKEHNKRISISNMKTYKRNPIRMKQAMKKYYRSEKGKATLKRWRELNKEKVNKWNRESYKRKVEKSKQNEK